MGASTVAIGVLPTYAQVGALAPALLVSLRFIQGVALGGEWAGAVLLSMEHGSDAERGRNASWAQMGPSTGVLVATGVIAVLTAFLPEAALLSWGWRVPLLASIVLVAFGLWLRLGVPETPQFLALERSAERARTPIGDVLRDHWRGLLIAGGSRFGPDVMYSFMSAFLLSYITKQLELSRTLATTALAVGAAFNVAFIYIAGGLSDRLGLRTIYRRGVLAAAAWVLLVFPLLNLRHWLAVGVALVSGFTIHSFMYGPQGAFIAEQFPARVRYAGSSLAYTFAGVFAGGIAPLAMTGLFGRIGSTWIVALYVIVALALTGIALAAARATRPK
jgi:MFS family permease